MIEVAKDSEAAGKGVRPGDIITKAGQGEVSSPAELSTKVDEAKKNGRKSILLLVKRQDDRRFVTLRPD